MQKYWLKVSEDMSALRNVLQKKEDLESLGKSKIFDNFFYFIYIKPFIGLPVCIFSCHLFHYNHW